MDHQLSCNSHVDDDGHGWTKVVSQKQKPADVDVSGNTRRFLTPTIFSAEVENESNSTCEVRSKRQSDSYSEEEDKKKPIVSLSEALAKIDQSSLAAFLVESMEKYSNDPGTQLRRFLDYIGRELTEVRFPWLEMFPLEGPWPKLMDVINVPFSDIPEPIYKTSVDWINQVSLTTFCGFVLSAFKYTILHVQAQQKGAKSGKIGKQPTSCNPYVAGFVTLAMVLRSRPNALTFSLSSLRERPIFQGQDKLPLTVWMMAQASKGNLSSGLFSWAHNLLPVVGNTNCNPQSRDLILQLVEKILSEPNAQTTLMNRAVREGDRLIPPPSFEILLRLTFPASSARVEATQRFEAIYPMLKEVALAGSPGGKAMKEVIQEIFTFSLKLAGEGNPALANEATSIAIWCVTENVDCCKDWENLYKENLEASVAVLNKLKEVSLAGAQGSNAMKQTIPQIFTFSLKLAGEGNPALAKEATAIASWCVTESIDCCKDWDSLYKANLAASVVVLKKLVDEWEDHSVKLSSSPSYTLSLSQTIKSFRLRNKKAITYGRRNASLNEEADKSCKVILWRIFRGSYSHYCLKATTITVVVLAAAGAAAAAVLSSSPEATTELKNLVNSNLHLYGLY